MNKIRRLRIIIILLIFFDFLFFNVKMGPIHITLLRVVLFLTVAILFFTLINKKIVKPRSKYISYTYFFFYIWMFYSIFQLFLVQDFNAAINKTYYLIIYFLIVLIFTTVNDKQEWIMLIKVISFVGIIIIFICLLEILTGIHLPTSRYYLESINNGRESTAVFYNQNDLGLFLTMIFPLIYYNDSKKIKFIKMFSLICIPVIIMINDNKAALIALGMQMFFIVLFSENSIKVKVKIYSIFAIVVVPFSAKILEMITSIVDQIVNSYGSAHTRLNIYVKGLYSLRESNYLGVGLGNFERTLIESFSNQRIVNPHNWWIELLVSSGVVIFFLYVVFFIGMIVETYKIYKKNMEKNRYVLAITITFIGFIIGSLGPSTTFDKIFVWLFYGVGLGVVNVFYSKKLISN